MVGKESPFVRSSKTVLDSGLHAVDSGFQALDSRFFVSGTWTRDSLSCIPDSKAQDSGFHKQKFLAFRNPDYLTYIHFIDAP